METTENENNIEKEKYFVCLQNRRFWSSIIQQNISLCPSMDLIAYCTPGPGITSGPPTSLSLLSSSTIIINIHRTMNWQKLSTITTVTNNGSNSSYNNNNNNNNNICWRPDGRVLAISERNNYVSLYSLEGLLQSTNDIQATIETPIGNTDSADDDELFESGIKLHTYKISGNNENENTNNNVITALGWFHVGDPHPQWPDNNNIQSEDDDDDDDYMEEQWEYRTRFLDQETNVLPKVSSSTQTDTEEMQSSCAVNTSNEIPNSQTPLSILIAITQSGQLHMLLHGRIPISIVDIDIFSQQQQQKINNNNIIIMAASADLTHLVVANKTAVGLQEEDHHPSCYYSLSIISTPALAKYRYDLQTISSYCCKIYKHISILKKSVPEIAASWKSSLKPLDIKLDGLILLLKNYGLFGDTSSDDTSSKQHNNNEIIISKTRSYIAQYILSGHHTSTARSNNRTNISNAIDQFFTGVQMNDQLIQRMERSLFSAITIVEQNYNKNLLSPSTALVYELDNLFGLMKYHYNNNCNKSNNNNNNIIQAKHYQQIMVLYKLSQKLLLIIQNTMNELIYTRNIIQDFCKYLRCIGSQIKARGTAINSIQRENAKKRRIPDTIIRRILHCLQQTQKQCNNNNDNNNNDNNDNKISTGGTTERLLGLQFISLLTAVDNTTTITEDEINNVDNDKTVEQRSSPRTVIGQTTSENKKSIPIPTILEKLSKHSDCIFSSSSGQKAILQHTVTTIHMSYPIQAITTRMGQGGIIIDDDDMFFNTNIMLGCTDNNNNKKGYFTPQESITTFQSTTTKSFAIPAFKVRQWTIIVQIVSRNCLQIDAIPLTWHHNDNNNDEVEGGVLEDDCCWTTRLCFNNNNSNNTNYEIRDVGFYNDDGKSTLQAGTGDYNKNKNIVEGTRQALGVLLSHPKNLDNDEPGSSSTEEKSSPECSFWLIPYNDLIYTCRALTRSSTASLENELRVDDDDNNNSIPEYSVISKPPTTVIEDDFEDVEDYIVYARVRHLSFPLVESTTTDQQQQQKSCCYCQISLCGSRGIGSVVAKHPHGGTVLEVLDLEEIEDGGDDDEDDDDDENNDEQEEEEMDEDTQSI